MPASTPSAKPSARFWAGLEISELRWRTHHIHRDAAAVRGTTVLEEKNALPGSEDHLGVGNRNRFTGSGERHADVGSHVIRTLHRVFVATTIFGNESLEISLQIPCRCWVGVFKNHKTRTRVADENGNQTLPAIRLGDDLGDLIRDLVKPLPASRNIKKSRQSFHPSTALRI